MVVHFETGWLLLVDPRRFATVSVELSRPSEDQEAVDPLAQGVLAVVQRRAQERRVSIKAFLMDQTTLAGIGNIYACEILHAAAVDPEKRACDLPTEVWQRLASVMPSILKKAIRGRGTTVSDWRDLFGRPGENQRVLKVYDRGGKPCFRCGAKVLRSRLGGRGTYFCPVCQA
jgi:formamidopyrimidine-DNA glycosylase